MKQYSICFFYKLWLQFLQLFICIIFVSLCGFSAVFPFTFYHKNDEKRIYFFIPGCLKVGIIKPHLGIQGDGLVF